MVPPSRDNVQHLFDDKTSKVSRHCSHSWRSFRDFQSYTKASIQRKRFKEVYNFHLATAGCFFKNCFSGQTEPKEKRRKGQVNVTFINVN